MPELPEVETVRTGLEPAMKGRVVAHVQLHRAGLRAPFPPDLAVRVEGRRVSKLSRRAKYLLIHFGSGQAEDILVIHLGMSGRMTALTGALEYKPLKHDHLVLVLEDETRIVFNDARRFGQAFVVRPEEMDAHKAFKGVGPEPLAPDFNGTSLIERFKGRKTPVKIALMDQRIVAGIGNIYACEALFEAGISPFTEAASITCKQAAALVAALKSVLLKAIAAGGSSLRDHRQADGTMGYFQHDFAVYGRTGEACPRKASSVKKNHTVLKTVQGGRSTFYCADCQKGPQR